MLSGITLPGRPDLENVRRLDIGIIPYVRACRRNGMRIDISGMRVLGRKLASNMERIEGDIGRLLPPGFLEQFTEETFNVDSPDQIAELLYGALGVGRGRNLKTTASGTRISTGKKQLELLRGEHPVIPLVLEYRENSKLKSTYAEALPEIAVRHPKGKGCPVCGRRHYSEEWRVHPEITTTRTSTGRFACKNPNLQNIPTRTELGREIRAQFIAGEGRRLISCDFSQIELRVLAHCANELGMIKVFQQPDGDIHLATAMEVFGLPAEKIDPLLHRLPCKNVNFMIVYGASAMGLQLQLALSKVYWTIEQCEDFVAAWFAKREKVRGFLDEQHYHARRYKMVWELGGRIRWVPEVRSSIEKVVEAGLRQAGNHRIQGTAATLMKMAMIGMEELHRAWEAGGLDAAPMMTIHDELLYEAEEEEAEGVAVAISRVMDGVAELRVPIKSDWKIGERWKKE
jgi:DNA polymerase-1